MKTVRIVTITLGIFIIGCGGRPTEVLNAAETALSGAALAKKCAPEEYSAAEKMVAKAQKLAEEEKYDEAEQAALAAQKLAKAASEKAEGRKEECERPKADTVSTESFVESGAEETPEPEVSGDMETVYFGFNASVLTDLSKAKMERNAQRIKSKDVQSKTVIEGHCDSRGSTEYNLALGEKRALAAKAYLIELGADATGLVIMSYGEERLDDYEDNEKAHTRNRRVEFRVQ
ncbi:MAG: OmpA family protein [Bradymonadia bacterium]